MTYNNIKVIIWVIKLRRMTYGWGHVARTEEGSIEGLSGET